VTRWVWKIIFRPANCYIIFYILSHRMILWKFFFFPSIFLFFTQQQLGTEQKKVDYVTRILRRGKSSKKNFHMASSRKFPYFIILGRRSREASSRNCFYGRITSKDLFTNHIKKMKVLGVFVKKRIKHNKKNPSVNEKYCKKLQYEELEWDTRCHSYVKTRQSNFIHQKISGKNFYTHFPILWTMGLSYDREREPYRERMRLKGVT